jgi:hypothetical protein
VLAKSAAVELAFHEALAIHDRGFLDPLLTPLRRSLVELGSWEEATVTSAEDARTHALGA